MTMSEIPPPPTQIGRGIAERVRSLRRQAGLSRRQLAEKADVSERYLNQLEAARANVSIGILGRIAAALDVGFEALLPLAASPAAPSPAPSLAPSLAALLAGMSAAEQAGAVPQIERYLQERRRAMRGIALLGLRGAGKSTLGALFAQRHGLPFVSVTREIERRAGMRIDDLFNLGRSEAYRSFENETIAELTQRPDRIVLETAGGIVSNPEALDAILGAYRTVWLRARPEDHLARVASQGDLRPMQGNPKAFEHLKTLLARREVEYARAEWVLDTSGRSPEACLAELEAIALPLLQQA